MYLKKLEGVLILLLLGSASAGLVLLSPYRHENAATFLDPWDDVKKGSDSQLSRALIAFGHSQR